MPDAITGDRPELKPVNIGAAAIDIGSKMHVAAVNPTCTDVPVRAFGTFTQDLHDLADWFKACGVTSVAMEFLREVGRGFPKKQPPQRRPEQLARRSPATWRVA
jgi:hypothetical protein